MFFIISVRTEEQEELIFQLPCVPAYSSVHYTPPCLNRLYPVIPSSGFRLHLTADHPKGICYFSFLTMTNTI